MELLHDDIQAGMATLFQPVPIESEVSVVRDRWPPLHERADGLSVGRRELMPPTWRPQGAAAFEQMPRNLVISFGDRCIGGLNGVNE